MALLHDYVDDTATEIDAGPHWSVRRVSAPVLQAIRALPPLPRPVQMSAARLPPPRPAPATPFYSYAEEVARQRQLDTELVPKLPPPSPAWLLHLAAAWQRFAIPACGAIAGLIFVVGYLAYSTQSAPVTTSTAPAITMPVQAAVAETEAIEVEPTVDVPVVVEAKPAPAAKKRPSSSKRRPVRVNTDTPLGDLRPSRR